MHTVGTRAEWRAAYERQLAKEKELTRLSTELARERRELPWVPVEKEYRFETTAGTRTLAELFAGRSQLIVRHFMHGPNTPAGCPGCTFETDNLVGAVPHLAQRDVTFVLASRSPLPVLTAYRERMGWDVEWVSSEGSDFNADLFDHMHVTTAKRDYGSGSGSMLDVMELMALSCFALEDETVYHTYSTYDRGTEVLNATWQLLDRAPKGRGEDFSAWPRKRDEYPGR
jgi:predicted dithiol-disulfide oxidoreductase (DUF899 family)